MIMALCGQAGGITKSGKPCRIRVSDSGRLCMAHDPQHRKNGLLAEDGDRNVTQTITDGIIKGIGDGPDHNHHEPADIHILYVDQEMTQSDLQERLHSLGYEQPDSTLAQHLHYYQLSPWPPLDSAAGGQRLLEEVHKTKAQLVVIDTLIRTVEGEENSADTIKNFNRYTAVPLKAAGIALLRIDHAGKDLTRGQRGTSAKRDDVDVVWLLKPASGSLPGRTSLTLKREAARIDWIQQDIHITRHEGPPLHHSIPTFSELTSADTRIVDYLQKEGLWRHNITYRSARSAMNRSTLMAKTQRLSDIVRWMKKYGDTHSESGEHAGEHTLSDLGEHAGERGEEKGNTQVREGEHEGNTEKKGEQGKGNISPP